MKPSSDGNEAEAGIKPPREAALAPYAAGGLTCNPNEPLNYRKILNPQRATDGSPAKMRAPA